MRGRARRGSALRCDTSAMPALRPTRGTTRCPEACGFLPPFLPTLLTYLPRAPLSRSPMSQTATGRPKSQEAMASYADARRREDIEMHSVHLPTAEAAQEKPPSRFQKFSTKVSDLVRRIDDRVSDSPVGRLFRLKGSGHVRTSAPPFSTAAMTAAIKLRRSLIPSSVASLAQGNS